MNRCLTIGEVAYVLQCNPKHVYYLLCMGEIAAWKIRKVWRVPWMSLEGMDSYDYRRIEELDHRKTSDHLDHQGNGFVPSLFGIDGPSDDMGKADRGVSRRRRVEHKPRGSYSILGAALKPVAVQFWLFAEEARG